MNKIDEFISPLNTDAHVRKPLSEERLQHYLAAVRSLAFGFESVADHVVITDPDANIIYANKAVEKNTGFSIHEIIGRNPGDLWGGQMSKEFYEKMWRAIKIEKRPFVAEVKNKRKDGAEYWQEIHISPVLWENGDVKFYIGIEPSIMERKEKEKFRDEFVAILAHQLKNPLASVQWTLDWLSKRGGLTPNQQQTIKTVYQHNESLINLVTDLLVFARIGDVPLPNEKLNLTQEIENIIRDVKRKNPLVSFSFENEGVAFLTASTALVSQVFLNLISNAAEYSKKTAGEVAIVLRSEGSHYIFSVKNNGVTIPLDDQPKIFSKFFRASNAREAKEMGTGLGLFIVKIICANLGWKVWFQSPFPNKDRGAIFFVEIPIQGE